MAKNKTYKPTKDIIFKLLFGTVGNEVITKKFIESIIKKEISNITLNHKLELLIKKPENKQMVADVIAEDENERKYILEMQRKSNKYLLRRFFGYGADVYLAGLKKSKDYNELKQTTLIVIMEEPFPGLKEVNEYHTVLNFAIKKHTDIEFEELIQMHIIELSKYKKQKKRTGKIEPWLEFIINPEGKEMNEIMRTQKELAEAVKQLRLLNADEEVRRIANAEEWAEIDRISELSIARKEGEERGEKRGERRGEKRGEKRGKETAKLQIAQNLLIQGMDIKTIIMVTGLNEKDIDKIKANVC